MLKGAFPEHRVYGQGRDGAGASVVHVQPYRGRHVPGEHLCRYGRLDHPAAASGPAVRLQVPVAQHRVQLGHDESPAGRSEPKVRKSNGRPQRARLEPARVHLEHGDGRKQTPAATAAAIRFWRLKALFTLRGFDRTAKIRTKDQFGYTIYAWFLPGNFGKTFVRALYGVDNEP